MTLKYVALTDDAKALVTKQEIGEREQTHYRLQLKIDALNEVISDEPGYEPTEADMAMVESMKSQQRQVEKGIRYLTGLLEG